MRKAEAIKTICWQVLWLSVGLLWAATGVTAQSLPWLSTEPVNGRASQAIHELQRASDHGLNPRHYQADELAQKLRKWRENPGAIDVDHFNTNLTFALAAYLKDLYGGRLNPNDAGARYRERAEAPSAWALLQNVWQTEDLAQEIRGLTPIYSEYGRLQRALLQYRALQGHPAWQAPLPTLPGGRLDPGDSWSGGPQLAARLQALGDLARAGSQDVMYAGDLVEAVQRFQARHGLVVDGILGPATLAALAVTPAERVRQIELTLERWRSTPLRQYERVVAINLPEFVLRGYQQTAAGSQVEVDMNVIIGRASRSPTPLFDETLQFIEFSPYWNVPVSIARADVIPRIRRDPEVFDQQGFEFVASDGSVSRELTDCRLEATEQGLLRLRQRPGAFNAMGGVKFVLPENGSIFLHHTPATHLFARDRRDFSFGCVRVAGPIELVRFALQDDPEWTEATIQSRIDAGQTAVVRVPQPLPVVTTYFTVTVVDDMVKFWPDIYGLDARMAEVLAQQDRARAAFR